MKHKNFKLKHPVALTMAIVLLLAVVGGVAYGHGEGVDDGNKAHNKHLLHDTDLPDGHVPPNTNYGFEVIGRDTLGGEADGKYTDVWAHKGYAYVGTFQEPTCDRSGVYISDINDPANPETVTMIKSPPNTRINDVKVHAIGEKDVLIFTLEQCGPLVGQVHTKQIGQGGISLWDVTNPNRPHALKQNFLDFPVHNTFPWTTDEGNTYLIIVDDVNVNDVHIADISKPQSPSLIATTGIGDWAGNTNVADDGQLFTGVFAAPLLHDVWVEKVGGQWQAVLSYWDAGFITLDVSDPANPQYLDDSTYPATDPVHGISPAEGNAHAAVFGGDSNQYIFGGDEDFDPFRVTVKGDGVPYNASQGSDVPQIDADNGVSGPSTYVGLACGDAPDAPSPDSIAVIQRGACAFTTKAQTVQAAGYQAAVVFNHATGCEESVSMLVEAGIPALFVPRSSGFALLGIAGYDPANCDGSGTDDGDPLLENFVGSPGTFIDISADFDGWGYFHLINNGDTLSDVPGFGEVGYLGHMGYYAPAELADPDLAVGAGDLTMHNVEVDPTDRNRAFISWYSLGMRAVEVRMGHSHDGGAAGYISRNVHEVGRFIADDGSNFWGVHVTEIDGQEYILGSDRNTGLWVFQFTCDGPQAGNSALYCNN